MTFALVPAMPYDALVSVISAASMNFYRVAISEAVDGTEGGTYSLGNQLIFTGAGLRLEGPTALELDATSVCTQDAGGVFNWNGAVNFIDDIVTFKSSATCNIGSLTSSSPATLNVGQDSVLNVNGVASHNATVNVGQYGVVNFLGSSNLFLFGTETVESGGSIEVIGNINVHPGGEINLGSSTTSGAVLQIWGGSQIVGLASSTLSMVATSTTTLASTNTLSGPTTVSNLVSTTQTGPFLKSGGSAYDVERVLAITSTGGTHSIGNPQNYDTIFVQGNTGALVDTIALSMPAGLPDGIRLRIVHPQYINKGTVLVSGTYNGAQNVNGTLGLGDTGGGGFNPVVTTGWCDVESATIGGVSQWIVTGFAVCT